MIEDYINKHFQRMLALLAGAMTVVSCGEDAFLDDEGNKDVPTPAQGTMTFTATVGEEDETTRASLNGLDIVWNQGDEISVFSSANFETNNKLTLTAGVGTPFGSFSGDCEQGIDYYAFYPYNSGITYYEKDPINVPINRFIYVWDGLQQTAVADSFDPRTPMMARTEGVEEGTTTVPLQFKNILSFVKLTTDFACKSITLTSKNEKENLAAKQLVLKVPDSGSLSLFATIDDSPSVALKGNDSALIAPGTYYIAVIPRTLTKGFDLTFSGISNTDLNLTKSTTKSVTLNRSEALNLGEIKLNDFKHDIFFGSGTEADPYRITSYDDWVLFISTLNGEDTYRSYWTKYYLMTDDIDCTSKDPFTTIRCTFFGHFNGNNHTLNNYRIILDDPSISNFHYCGLFSYLKNAVIENLNCVLDDIVWDKTKVETYYREISPFINLADCSTISNCHLSGTKTLQQSINPSSDIYFGCLIGYIFAKDGATWVQNCSNALNVELYTDRNSLGSLSISLGGIVGHIEGIDKGVKIDRCKNTGNMKVYGRNDLQAGGIAGSAKDTDLNDVELYITNCVNKGNIIAGDNNTLSSDDAFAGGIVGKLDTDGEHVYPHIYNSLNQGKIEAYQEDKAWAGGIVGWAFSPITNYDDPHLFNCANRGQTVGKSGAYPFVGNTGDYNLDYAKCCINDYSAPGELHRPSILASEMNENIGYAKIQSATGNNSNWVNYTWGCCRWTGAGSSLDLDFSSSVE